MLKLKENVDMNDGIFFIRGNVKIYDNDKIILNKDNAITNNFRKMLMKKLYDDIIPSKTEVGTSITAGYINSIKFGRGTSASLGIKASKDDTNLILSIPDTISTNETTSLKINKSIEDLNIVFNYDDMKIQISAELENNDAVTYILGELGIFTNSSPSMMLTHLFFDPIHFKPNTTKKIVYTIYFY